MNREQHLLQTAPRVAAWPHHSEHLIVDWSSRRPLRRDALPPDPRLRLLRVEGEQRWNLCRAYNFAVAQASGSCLFKLDADCWPGRLDPEEVWAAEPEGCWFGSGPDGRLGQFLMTRRAFAAVGGFNEVLVGYGFDDKDLKARLQSLGWEVRPLPQQAVEVIVHSIHERVSRRADEGFRITPLQEALSFAQRRASAISNRVAAAFVPWTAQRAAIAASHYEALPDGGWRVVSGSIPLPPAAVADELARLRRQVFWGRWLEIPEAVVNRLPQALLPLDRQGEFPLRWWHRLYWRTVRRLQAWLVLPLQPGLWKGRRQP